MDEKINNGAQQLDDEQLEGVNGGAISVKKFGGTYVFVGKADQMDRAFICPQCSKALRYAKAGQIEFFRCDSCKRNFTTTEANPNFGSGLWMKLY